MLSSALCRAVRQVWDLHEAQPQLLYKSHVLCASPLVALSVDPSYPRVAVGGCDGAVRVLDLAGLPAVRLLQASCATLKYIRLTRYSQSDLKMPSFG